MRALYTCRVKTCGTVWARDYTEKVGGRWLREIGGGDGERRVAGEYAECVCPVCGTYNRSKMKAVAGEYSDKHRCNDACRNAIGHACRCSCGGANHAGARLMTCDDMGKDQAAALLCAGLSSGAQRTEYVESAARRRKHVEDQPVFHGLFGDEEEQAFYAASEAIPVTPDGVKTDCVKRQPKA